MRIQQPKWATSSLSGAATSARKQFVKSGEGTLSGSANFSRWVYGFHFGPTFWIIVEQNHGLPVKHILEFRLLLFGRDWRYGREGCMERVFVSGKKSAIMMRWAQIGT